MTLTDQRKLWKAEGISFGSVVSGYFDLEKAAVSLWENAVKFVVANGITSIDRFEAVIDQVNKEELQRRLNNDLAAATTDEDIQAVQVAYIHQKTTKQHEEGTFKVSILPVAYRTAISVIGSCLVHKISLVVPVRDGKTIVGFAPAKKSDLDRLIKLAKNPDGVKEEEKDTIVDEAGDNETITLNSEDNAITRLEAVVHAMRHILAEIDDEQELVVAHAMVDTVWDLSPMKIAAEA
jgi:hypothetical protein